jgi:hypothetical protein
MDVDLGRASVCTALFGRAFLLACLILVLAGPAPAVLSGGVDRVPGSGAEGGAPEDTSPAEDETPRDIAPWSVPRWTHGPGRFEALAFLVSSPRGTHRSPRLRGQRPGSIHLQEDGRTLRLRLRSLTC